MTEEAARRPYPVEHDMRDLVVGGTTRATLLTELGFAVAFGILLDTIVVRPILVIALDLDVRRVDVVASGLARTPGPAPAEASRERAGALTGA